MKFSSVTLIPLGVESVIQKAKNPGRELGFFFLWAKFSSPASS